MELTEGRRTRRQQSATDEPSNTASATTTLLKVDAPSSTRSKAAAVEFADSTSIPRFIPVPPELLAQLRKQPSLLGHLAVACTACGRWVPFELTDSIPDVYPTSVDSKSVVLRDAVFASHLPAVLHRRSARGTATVASSTKKGSSSAFPELPASRKSSRQQRNSNATAAEARGDDVLGTTAINGTTSSGPHNFLNALAPVVWYMPNPACYRCNWTYCKDSDPDFIDSLDTVIPSHTTANHAARSSAATTAAQQDDGDAPPARKRRTSTVGTSVGSDARLTQGNNAFGVPLVAQCCLCQKWRRVRRPHPSVTGFSCALSPYADNRSCALPENIEWLSDLMQSSDKLRALLRRSRKTPKYLDPRAIRDSRQLLHRQRVTHAPALFGSLGGAPAAGTSGSARDNAIDVDQAGVLATARVAASGRKNGGNDHASVASEGNKSVLRGRVKKEEVEAEETTTEPAVVVPPKRGRPSTRTVVKHEDGESDTVAAAAAAAAAVKAEDSSLPTDRKRSRDADDKVSSSSSSPNEQQQQQPPPIAATPLTAADTRRRRKKLTTKWIQCDHCEKWRIVGHELPPDYGPNKKWWCTKRPLLPVTCKDPEDQVGDEEDILRRMGLIE